MIYMHTTLVPVQGKGMEFLAFLAGEFIPFFEKCGGKLLGSWQTAIGKQGEIIDIWSFDSLAHYEQVIQKMVAENEFATIFERLQSLIVEENIKILAPLPFSPLK